MRVLGFVEKLGIPEADLAMAVSLEDPEGATLLLETNANPIAKTYQKAVYQAGGCRKSFSLARIFRRNMSGSMTKLTE